MRIIFNTQVTRPLWTQAEIGSRVTAKLEELDVNRMLLSHSQIAYDSNSLLFFNIKLTFECTDMQIYCT